MTDIDRLDRLRGYFHTGEIPITTPHCLDAETVGALADGTLQVDARARTLRHLLTCAFCRRAVASVAEALADGPVTHEIEVVEGRAGRWWRGRTLRIAVPLAAAATVLVLLWSPTNDVSSPHRAGVQPTVGPKPISPSGTVAGVQRLEWTSVQGADRYRVTLFAAQGGVLHETQAADTSVMLPDSVRLIPGTTYLWKVDARTGWDRWASSELVAFTIARAPPP